MTALPTRNDAIVYENPAYEPVIENATDNSVYSPTGMDGSSLANYQLTRDREPRISRINPKYANVLESGVNTTEFSLLIVEHVRFSISDTFEDAIVAICLIKEISYD